MVELIQGFSGFFDKGEYFIDEILLEFRLLSTLLVLQKVVYLIRQNKILNLCFLTFLFSRGY